MLPAGGLGRLRAHSRFEAATRRGHRVAHHLRAVIVMLRLKGEPDADDALPEDESRSRPVDRGETDEITGKDVFQNAGRNAAADDEDEPFDPWRPERTFPLRGLVIAGAAFAPIFLLIFFGLPYLVDSAAPTRTPGAPVATVVPELDPKSFPSLSEAAGGDARAGASDSRGAPGDRTTGDLFRNTARSASIPPARIPDEPKVEERTAAVAPDPVPSLPPARPAPAERPAAPEPRAPETPRAAALPPTSAPAPAPAPPAVPEPRRGGREAREWTPAAAFTDRAAAGRLASSIEKQGYPVEIRQDASSSRPWVVWIGAQPSGGSRRR
jgi:hypothetical protein